jgi:DNA-binding beta-propeller fold protein YncE
MTRPHRVAGYILERELARGPASVVYLAREVRSGRAVAVKALQAALEDSAGRRRFAQEAAIATALTHRNIVAAYGAFEHEGVPHIVMEFLPYGSLRRLVGRLALPEALAALDDALAGLAHAHAHDVIHRDLKPENLLVGHDGRVKIADFGIAKALAESGAAALRTATGSVLGTPAYMAPEQVRGAAVGPWTDLYAIGVTAYELIARRQPYADAGSPAELVARHVLAPVPRLESVLPDVDPQLAAWVEGLLAKNPEDRPAEASSAREDLHAIARRTTRRSWPRRARRAIARHARDAAAAPAVRPGVAAPRARPTRRWSGGTGGSRRPRVATILAATAVIAAGTALAFALGGDTPRRGSGSVLGEVRIGRTGGRLGLVAVGARSVWATNYLDDTISRIDAATMREVPERVPVGRHPADVWADDRVWVVNDADGTVSVIDPTRSRVAGRPIRVGRSPAALRTYAGYAWVTLFGADAVRRIDIADGKAVGAPIPVGDQPDGLAVAGQVVWVANFGDGTVSRIDPVRARAIGRPIPTGRGPTDVAGGGGAVWVVNSGEDTIARLEARSDGVAARISVGGRPTCAAFAGGRVWATVGDALVEISPTTNRVTATHRLRTRDNCVRAGPGGLWVSLGGSDSVARIQL